MMLSVGCAPIRTAEQIWKSKEVRLQRVLQYNKHNHVADDESWLLRQKIVTANKRRAQRDVFERPSKFMMKEMIKKVLEILTVADRAQISGSRSLMPRRRSSLLYRRYKEYRASHKSLRTVDIKRKFFCWSSSISSWYASMLLWSCILPWAYGKKSNKKDLLNEWDSKSRPENEKCFTRESLRTVDIKRKISCWSSSISSWYASMLLWSCILPWAYEKKSSKKDLLNEWNLKSKPENGK